jgi:hypothetical protein
MARLRGHHLVCLHFYDGEGYDEPFIRNLEKVLAEVRRDGAQVVDGADDICILCRHRCEGRCTYSAAADREIREMDRKALALLTLAPGDRADWEGTGEIVVAGFREWYAAYCFACSWRPVCEKNPLFLQLSEGVRS